jgi:hypothetical protein
MVLGLQMHRRNLGWRAVRVALVVGAGISAAACKKADPKHDETARANRGGGVEPGAVGGGGAMAADPTTDSDDKADPSYQFMAQHPEAGPAGVETIARFVIHPGPGYKMNKEFPTKLTLEPPAEVVIAKPVLGIADADKFSDKELTFSVKLTAQQPGEFTIPATVRFAVCTDATCDPKKKQVALLMTAE